MRFSSSGSTISRKETEVLHWLPEWGLKRQPYQQLQWLKTRKQLCFRLSPWWIKIVWLAVVRLWDGTEQKKGNHKLLLKYILRQLNSEGVKRSDDRGSPWYVKLHIHVREVFPKNPCIFQFQTKFWTDWKWLVWRE